AGFLPTATNRIATCISGTSFGDSGGLAPGATYYYVVRAEDSSGNGSGACRAGIEETNAIRRSGSPQGSLVPVNFSDGAEGAPQMTMGSLWSQSSTRAHTGSRSYFGDGFPLNSCAALTTPTLVPSSTSSLSFWSYRDNLENTYDGGIAE